MKHFKFQYSDSQHFAEELRYFKRRKQVPDSAKMVFTIYTVSLNTNIIDGVRSAIAEVFPDADYIGCSTNGNIVDRSLASGISIFCTVFEHPSTRFMIRQYDLTEKTVNTVAADIKAEISSNPWVKAVELYFAVLSGVYAQFCTGLDDVPPEVHIFGGISSSEDVTTELSCVFTKTASYSNQAVAAIFYGGEEFYVDSVRITGWKALKRKFRVTSAKDCTIKELDGVPAYNIFQKYLGIPNDENFFLNTLEFPLLYEHDGISILRAPVASHPDGSVDVAADVVEGSVVHFAYGDPRTAIGIVNADSHRIKKFQPDVIHIFSCAARRAFWNETDPTYELHSLKDIAPSLGFFTRGEFIRTNSHLNPHNVTLVIAAMREGKRDILPESETSEAPPQTLAKVPLVSRLATFIAEFSSELEDINARLEQANENLKIAAITDGLTRLYNRKEIQTRIGTLLKNISDQPFSLVMLDLDNFKQVNDTYGHQKGDEVIIALADTIRRGKIPETVETFAGRWGGEEFMLLLPGVEMNKAVEIAEHIRTRFADTQFERMRRQTVSIGVTQAKASDNLDSLCIRVDTALYAAKNSGKNRVVAQI